MNKEKNMNTENIIQDLAKELAEYMKSPEDRATIITLQRLKGCRITLNNIGNIDGAIFKELLNLSKEYYLSVNQDINKIQEIISLSNSDKSWSKEINTISNTPIIMLNGSPTWMKLIANYICFVATINMVKRGEYILSRDYSGLRSGTTIGWHSFINSKFNDDNRDIFKYSLILNIIDANLNAKIDSYEETFLLDVIEHRRHAGYQPTIFHLTKDILLNKKTLIGDFYLDKNWITEDYIYLRQQVNK